MIYKDCTITINKGVATISEPIILYRGDKEVELCFEIKENLYKYSDGTNIVSSSEASYSQIVIKVPNNKPPIFGEILETKEGKAVLKVTSEMIDEIDEVGFYDFQVRLFDKSKTSRITIPPVEKGIEIREPIAIEDESTTNEVGIAKVGYAQVGTKGVQRPTLNEDGSYNRKFWIDKEPITKEDLNVLEDIVDKNTTQVKESATKKYVDEQCKDIAKDVLLEDGKLYLKKSDGTKLGTGVILPISGSGGSVTWESLTGKPSTFTPSSHVHNKSDITDFPTIPTKTSELNNDSGFLTSHQDLSNYVQKESGKGLSTNDLTTTLKQNYDNAYTHSQSTHAPANAQKNSDITKEEIEAKLTGEISTHSHANGSVTGSEFKKVIETTFGEDCYAFTVTQDKDGKPLQLKEGIICVTVSQPKNTEAQIMFGVGFLDWISSYNSKSSIYNVALMKNYEFYRLNIYFKIINNKVLAINLGTTRTGTVAPSFNDFDSVNSNAKVDMSNFRTLQNNYIDKIVIGLDMANTGLISGDSILEVWSI